jgi:hypothetical protein
VAALLRRVHPSRAQVDGPGRSATRHRYAAQLPLLRARLYSSRRRRPESASRWLRHVRRLLRPGSRGARHPGASHGKDTSALLAVRRGVNLVGVVDLILDYYHATQVGLPALAGQLGATYAIPIIYVPVLMITHVVAFYLVLRPQPKAVGALADDAAAS